MKINLQLTQRQRSDLLFIILATIVTVLMVFKDIPILISLPFGVSVFVLLHFIDVLRARAIIKDARDSIEDNQAGINDLEGKKYADDRMERPYPTNITKKNEYSSINWSLSIVILFFGAVWFFYGSISPCEILKTEISRGVSHLEGDAPMAYMIFGGFVERRIDMLSPSECVIGIYQIRTKGLEIGVDHLISIGNTTPSQFNVEAPNAAGQARNVIQNNITTQPPELYKKQWTVEDDVEYKATHGLTATKTSLLDQTKNEAASYQQILLEKKAAREAYLTAISEN